MRKIIRPGQWEALRRRAQDAVYPNPPEPAVREPTDARLDLASARAERSVVDNDARRFPDHRLQVALVGTQLVEEAGDPEAIRELEERDRWLLLAVSRGAERRDALSAMRRVMTDPSLCPHHGEDAAAAGDAVVGGGPSCACVGFCSCRDPGIGRCPPKYAYRFGEPAKLLRQWSRRLFTMTTMEVSALLTLDAKLAAAAIEWARERHAAWCSRHGLSLVELEEAHSLIRPRDVRYSASAPGRLANGYDVLRCEKCLANPKRTLSAAHRLANGWRAGVFRCDRCGKYETFYLRDDARE